MYTLYLIKPETGQVLNLDGKLLNSGEVLQYEHTFSKEEDALAMKEKLLKIVVWALVLIHNDETKEENFYSNK